MRAAFVHHKGRIMRLPQIEEGESPTEFFYGAIEFARRGIDVGQFEVDPNAESCIVRAIGDLIPQNWTPIKTDIPLINSSRRLVTQLNNYDCVIATAGNIAFALAFWRAMGM